MKPIGVSIALVLLLLSGCVVNPVTGEKELSFVTNEQELALGDSLHPAVIYDYDGEYHDPELKRYLGTIVLRLHKVSHRSEMPVDFKILNASIFNAFAIPGHVYVTRGALARMCNEGEFAAVMGHEIAHYTARHSASQLTRQQLTQIVVGVPVSILADQGSTAGTLLAQAGALGAKLAQLHYSRSQEEQADRVGTYYLYRAGYEPTRMIDMQELLHRVAGGGESTFLGEYLSTHPSGETRVRRIEEVIRQEKLDDGKRLEGDGTFAERWQRRLHGLRERQKAYDVFDRAQAHAAKGEVPEALRLCRQARSMAPDQAPFHRLEGDLLYLMKRPEQARAPYRKALDIDARYLPALRGLAGATLALGDYPQAEKEYTAALRLLPNDLASHYGLGLSYFHRKMYPEAAARLEGVVRSSSFPPAWCYLGRTYEGLGQSDKAAQAYRACVQAAEGTQWQSSPAVDLARTRLEVLGPGPASP